MSDSLPDRLAEWSAALRCNVRVHSTVMSAAGQTELADQLDEAAEALREAVVIVASHADEPCEYHEVSHAGCSVCEAHDWIEKAGSTDE